MSENLRAVAEQVYALMNTDNARDYVVLDFRKGLFTSTERGLMHECAAVAGQLLIDKGIVIERFRSKGTLAVDYDDDGNVQRATFTITLNSSKDATP